MRASWSRTAGLAVPETLDSRTHEGYGVPWWQELTGVGP